MSNKDSENTLNFFALIFGNNEFRELGKETSEWFNKIFDAMKNDEPGFSEFILMAELRYGKIISKEELIPTNSLLVKKMRKKAKEDREKLIIDFFRGDEFDGYCKNIFYLIKECMNNGNT